MAEMRIMEHTQCSGPGCSKLARVVVMDKAGRRIGQYCKACGHRALLRALRGEGVRPFAGLDAQR